MAKTYIDVNTNTEKILDALRHGGLLLTTKAGDKVNSMVIGWGTIGINWGKPVFAVYVRKGRFTRELLDKNPEFTINVPVGEVDRNIFRICGSKSGRDLDKITEAGLTTVDGEKVSDIFASFEAEKLKDNGVVIRKGKKSFKKLVLKND